jgi:DNA primase
LVAADAISKGAHLSQRNAGHSGADFKSLVLQATDIVQLIGQSVALKRRGKDYVGLCPFHQEKSPSFHVSPGKQFFHCYGCKAGGNAIDFVIKRDRIEFLEAMKFLAQKAGIDMPKFGVSKEKTSERQQLLEANSMAAAFFQQQLTTSDAAKEYLDQRGFNAESIKKFSIGVASDSWDALLHSNLAKKFSPQLLAMAGLVKPRQTGEGFYDTFRNRLMFPIRDENARVIAFGGRVMPGSDDPAKYLNSPETPLFSKSRCVFGLDLARQRIVESRIVAVVEGYTDVIMAHQYGVTNVVSILGTAMTEQHIHLLRRFADRIVLLFDADIAGETAVNRAVELFLTQPIEIAIASIPEDLDPDEYLLKHGAEAFDALLASAADALTFKWKLMDKQYRAAEGDLTSQQRIVEEYLSMLADARGSGPVDQMRWVAILNRVSRLTGISVEQLNKRFSKKNLSPVIRTPAQVAADSSPMVQPPKQPLTARDRAEQEILAVLLVQPPLWHEIQKSLGPEQFSNNGCRKLAEVYWDHQRHEGEPVFNEFLGILARLDHKARESGAVENSQEDELTSLAIELVEKGENMSEPEAILAGALALLAEIRSQEEAGKQLAELRRIPDPSSSPTDLSEAAEIAALKALQENSRKPHLRRVIG